MAVASFPGPPAGSNRTEEVNAWWSTLRHEGVLISPLVLEEALPTGPQRVPDGLLDYLRNRYQRFINQPDNIGDWLDAVFERLLGQMSEAWRNGPRVPMEYRGQRRKATRVLLAEPPKEKTARLLVYVDKDRVTTSEGTPGRIGFHKGRREYAEFVRLLQETGVSLGVLTNGHQFRLIHTTLDQARWVEWDAKAWFEGGDGRAALHGFVSLLGEEALPIGDLKQAPIFRWIQDSRQRQADLSHVMGTQVREAVEVLLQEVDDCLMQSPPERQNETLARLRDLKLRREEELRALYQAAIRVVMRLVVVLYAESRELFPVSNPVYHDSYSVEGLFRILQRARTIEGDEALQREFDAWPRLQALFRFVHSGSIHPDLILTPYDGDLFRPARPKEDDEVAAAITVLEHPLIRISDAAILKVLEKLKVGQFKTGRGSWQTGPVDFKDLRTEYIGMMYEGLLDYDLREARKEDGGIVVLNLGDQPALPFRVLQHAAEDPNRLKRLIDDLKKKTSSKVLTSEEADEDEEEDKESPEKQVEAEAPEEAPEEDGEEIEEYRGDVFERAVHAWAKEVVKATGIFMPSPGLMHRWDPTRQAEEADRAARKLVLRAIPPGGTYLVRWSGTRKGTGTFYTKPGLAVPTVYRTLEPLVYETGGDGHKVPKLPEEILRLKVCDPAMGSGSFLVAALNYITGALKESFEVHILSLIEKGAPVTVMGQRSRGVLNERILPVLRDEEHEDIDARMEAQLKRAVVEHCIYGVDINPLAVELGKLSLWVETMDPNLPFTFLDHKIRCGNSLIGAWLHEYMHYPIAAWLREGGDRKDGARTKRIKKLLNERIKPQMVIYLQRTQHDTHWFEEKSGLTDLTAPGRAVFEKLHAAPSEEDRERIYREEFKISEEVIELRRLLDRWCAIWFWPVNEGTSILDPEAFYGEPKNEEIDEVVRRLAHDGRLRFFHWELEFPDVFTLDHWGFDAVFGNPPWDTVKANSIEFFTRIRPEYHTYGKREAIEVQQEMFHTDSTIEMDWIEYQEFFRSLKNYIDNVSHSYDVDLERGKRAALLSQQWSSIREKVGRINKRSIPYRYHGTGIPNLYIYFVEQMIFLLHPGGRYGAIVPSGLYTDHGTKDIRQYLLTENTWVWLYGFVNRRRIFNIHGMYKFAAIILQSGREEIPVLCNFMVEDLERWGAQEVPEAIKLSPEQIKRFSPYTMSIIEVASQRDVEILDKIYNTSRMIGSSDDTPKIDYSRGFNLTDDRERFKDRSWWHDRGYQPGPGGIWRKDASTIALPLYLGIMVYQFDFSYKGWSRISTWEEIPHDLKEIRPRFLMDDAVYTESGQRSNDFKIAFRDITNAANQRTMVAALIPDFPCGNTAPILTLDTTLEYKLFLLGILNSYVFDYVIRHKTGSTHLNWYIVAEGPIPRNIPVSILHEIAELSAKLNYHQNFFHTAGNAAHSELTSQKYEMNPEERAHIREKIDALVIRAYSLTDEDMKWILRPNNPDRRNLWKDYKERLKLMEGNGYWGKLKEEHRISTRNVEESR